MVTNTYLCPVCGYDMQDPPSDYNICPCCGTEFGHHDVNATIQDLRAAWFQGGLRWWSNVEGPPVDWNPFYQLAKLRSLVDGNVLDDTASDYLVVTPGGASFGWGQPGDTQFEEAFR